MTIPKTLRRIIRPAVLELDGKRPSPAADALAAQLGVSVDAIVKLDMNENPYGTTIHVQEALASLDRYHRYPDPNQTTTRQRLAQYTGMPAERIMIGNGSAELLDLILLATIDPGDQVIVPIPTYESYAQRPVAFAGVVRPVSRTPEFELDIEAIEAAITERTKLILVASPNNPTGNMLTSQQLVRLLRTGALVVVDEAYYEFATKTLLPYTREFDNIVVLRTFSKWAGLAGLRVGYGIFPPALAEAIWAIKQPNSVSIAGLKAIEAVLDDIDYIRETISRIRVERGRLYRSLRKLNFLQPYPSLGNFLLCRVTRGDAHDIYRRLCSRGILVRRFDSPELRNYLRISVGRPEDTNAVMDALRSMAEEV